ncbi:MAG: hypothetical protein IPL58_06575 [Betaproteobacteria bacterium]|uniref:Uncharacterized protein n=1 Tax=Candidatus Proximibacter danicus TaxID=2954365 RepID=A0A9D7PR82_9PROT|nr:hypothetical protein [Candidatus Proximibacter danicus]
MADRFWVGCAAPKIDYDIGVKITVLPDDTGGVETVGFAIDLDQGVAHFQQNGNWLRGGSSRNDPHKIRSGAAYVCAVEAVLNIQTLIDRKLATVNFGESPFRYAPLAGFLPLHTGFQWVQGGETADRPSRLPAATGKTGDGNYLHQGGVCYATRFR